MMMFKILIVQIIECQRYLKSSDPCQIDSRHEVPKCFDVSSTTDPDVKVDSERVPS